MLSNAVSTAVDRLYATAPRLEDRVLVDRVGAVVRIDRVRPLAQGEAKEESEPQHDDRVDAQQRHALARGVRAVFEAAVLGEPTTVAKGAGADIGDEPADRRPITEDPAPDPLLERAILRFIHSMFRSLAEAEGQEAEVDTTARIDGPGAAATGRARLSARIEALGRRLADSAGEVDAVRPGSPALGGSGAGHAPGEPAYSLDQAFAEVLQALSGNLGGNSSGAETRPELRANLAQLMQRLAHAMHGAPPVDPGLPTRGALLSERA